MNYVKSSSNKQKLLSTSFLSKQVTQGLKLHTVLLVCNISGEKKATASLLRQVLSKKLVWAQCQPPSRYSLLTIANSTLYSTSSENRRNRCERMALRA